MTESSPPTNCQYCTAVQHTLCGPVERWTCGRMLHMHPACGHFVPLANGRSAQPAKPEAA